MGVDFEISKVFCEDNYSPECFTMSNISVLCAALKYALLKLIINNNNY